MPKPTDNSILHSNNTPPSDPASSPSKPRPLNLNKNVEPTQSSTLNRLPEALQEFKETWLSINPERLLLEWMGYRALDKVAKRDFRHVVMGLEGRVDEVVDAMEEIDRNERK
jgi:hypothetical protein